MIPSPLHPAVVHFPIVLMAFLPLIVAGVLWAMRRGASPRVWGLAALTAALLAGSAFVAVRTGSAQEDTVEAVVPAQALHDHEEAAEVFLIASAVVLALAFAGFAKGTPGRAARVGTLLGALVLVVLGWRVGDQGGKLVYQHGAASAYTSATPAGSPGVANDDDDR